MNKTTTIFISILLTIISSCTNSTSSTSYFNNGVSLELSRFRSQNIEDVKYNLQLEIEENKEAKILGYESITFTSLDNSKTLLLDFKGPDTKVLKVIANNDSVDIIHVNDHIHIDSKYILKGQNTIEISFVAGKTSLNINDEFLYSLFVPDRASTCFPCFDQPDIKALYSLNLVVPKKWKAVSNSPIQAEEINSDGKKSIIFSQTDPLSTYLFSFVAGEFQVESYTDGKYAMDFYHRESDTALVNANLNKIFTLHTGALKWLEEYTDIKYPFKKFDFVAIPSFQYGGMEHPGAILYRASKLFLNKNADIKQKLGRANLISHETAHIWYGDLVTMKWFNDVWLKEVFANFMADKIVNPAFPHINHKLQFLMAHFAQAYEIDRTIGANPVGQQLENMNNAGTLYGSIIYHKAPIVMNHLEKIMGSENLNKGLKEYLEKYSYSNATWDNLISILNKYTDEDLFAWSRNWIESSGMPTYSIDGNSVIDNKLALTILQTDRYNNNITRAQWLNIEVKTKSGTVNKQVYVKDKTQTISIDTNEEPEYIFLNSDGEAYGRFSPNKSTLNYLLNELSNESDPVKRGMGYITLWEEYKNETIEPEALLNTIIADIKTEDNTQLTSLLLGKVKSIFWKGIDRNSRDKYSEIICTTLQDKIDKTDNKAFRLTYFKAFMSVATSKDDLSTLYNVWSDKTKHEFYGLGERELTSLAYQLALKNHPKSSTILDTQLTEIKNSDRKEKFQFIRPAVSKSKSVRDSLFASFATAKNRDHETWVVEAVQYLNHPLNKNEAYLTPGLELLQEIKVTGDIFFPKQWLEALFWGHDKEVLQSTVQQFLITNEDYPEALKLKILQSADIRSILN